MYLWHWPVLIGAQALWARPGQELPLGTALLAVVASAIPAWFAYRFVEHPLHASSVLGTPRRALAAALVCVAVGLGSSAVVHAAADRREALEATQTREADPLAHPGAAVLGDSAPPADWRPADRDQQDFVPTPTLTADDIPELDGEPCIYTISGGGLGDCAYGDPDGPVVFVVGDSKMHQWLGALQDIADRRGWRLVTRLQSACPFADVLVSARNGEPNAACADRNAERIPDVLAGDADYVLLSQGKSKACSTEDCTKQSPDLMRQAIVDVLERVRDAGATPVVVADNAQPAVGVMDCVAAHPTQVSRCEFELKPADELPLQRAAQSTGTPVVDVQPWITPGDRGWPVIGGIAVYRQGSHLTDTYARSLAPILEKELVAAGLP